VSREPLLSAKLAAAPRSGAVVLPRPRLFRQLDAGTAGPLTLVSASAGWGKTMLLSSWYEARRADDRGMGDTLGWLSVEPGDGRRLWAYVAAALRPAVPDAEPDVGDEPDHRYGLAHLAEEIAARPEPVTLVLDDLHQADDPEVVAGLEFLLRHTAGRLRLVVAGRTDPGLALRRWRLSGELTEIRAVDLAFRSDELADLFAAYGLPLSPDEGRRLLSRTEGWAAGLRFAALARAGHPDAARCLDEITGEHPAIADYLTEELLAGLPAETREALCRVCLAATFSAELVDTVTGRADGDRLVTDLDRHGGFVIPLGGRPPAYRLHPMLGDLLRAEVARRPADQLAELHRRTAEWSAARDLPGEALRHALAGADWRYAATILLRHWPDLVPYGQSGPPRATPPPPPPEVLRSHPELALACAADRLDARDPASARGYLDLAADLTGPLGDDTHRYRLRRIGAALRLAAAQLTGDVAAVEAGTADLLELGRVDPDRSTAAARPPGPHPDATRIAPDGGDAGRVGPEGTGAGEIGDGRADPVRAGAGPIGVDGIDVPGLDPACLAVDRAELAVARLLRAALRLAGGDLGAEAELIDGLADAEAAGLSRATRLCQGRLALVRAIRGRLREADEAARAALGAAPHAVPARPADGVHAHLARALVALHRDRPDEAEANLSLAAQAAESVTEPMVVVLVGLIEAQVLRDRGDLPGAHQALAATRRRLRDQLGPPPSGAGADPRQPVESASVHEWHGRSWHHRPADRPGARLLEHWLLAAEAEVRIAHGDLEPARELLAPAVAAGGSRSDGYALVAPVAVALSRTYLRAGDPHAALRTLPDWDGPEASGWPLPTRLEAGLLDAGAARQTGDQRRAARTVERVLELAEPDGYRRVFTRADPPVRELLTTHLDSGTRYWPLVSDLIAASDGAGGPAPALARLGEPLTERELTVLRYLQSILSNVEIAAELSLSVNTVKTHIRNIYRKLDATRRRDAVRRARELHLL